MSGLEERLSRSRMALAEVGRPEQDIFIQGGRIRFWRSTIPRIDVWRAREIRKMDPPLCWECRRTAPRAVFSTEIQGCEATWWLVPDCGRPR
jgi:hypothetical protein